MNSNKSKISYKRGFTLIELLVVVLIIGILAAVAVPQYKKAVLKSRLVQLQVYMDALRKGAELYYLSNNTYTNDIQNLDIDITGGAKEIKQSTITSDPMKAAFFENGIECLTLPWGNACSSNDFYLFRRHDYANPVFGLTAGLQCWGNNKARGDNAAEAVCKSMAITNTNYQSSLESNGYVIAD